MKKFVLPLAAAVTGAGILAVAAHARGFAGHGFHGHKGSPAMMACMAVMSQQERTNLKQPFRGEEQTLATDRQNVQQAKEALAQALLSGSKDVSTQESALSTAGLKLIRDQDALTTQVCGQLTPAQLNAALTLYKNLTSLRETSRRQARAYFQVARTAANK